MFCSQCGGQNSDSSNFCRSCGRSLDASRPASQKIRIADLPDVSKNRLLLALKEPSPETLVINESRLGWAMVGLTGSTLGLVYVVSQANGYKWQSEDIATNLFLVVLCFVIGWVSASYLAKWFRYDFKPRVLLNPLYFLRFRFDRIDAVSMNSTRGWEAKHRTDSRGGYAASSFSFEADGKPYVFKTKSLQEANEIVLAIKRFPEIVSSLIEKQNSAALYSFDLLYEWRRREEAYPRPAIKPPTGLRYVIERLGPTLVASIVGGIIFFWLITPYNDRCDDELRWRTAKTTATATAYRIYVASRPDGQHVPQAQSDLSSLYDRAAQSYRNSTGMVESEGIEAVIKILEYAKASGRYKVIVHFAGDNEIPEDIDARMRATYGFARLVPILPSFTAPMNLNREARILARISASIGKVIPGDILQFATGDATPQDSVLNVAYVITARDHHIYYPEKQEHIPEENRDWYTAVSFRWQFNVVVPGVNESTFTFSLDSNPAERFDVATQHNGSRGGEFSPSEAYGAMADSAFNDFGSKLLSELSVN
jgi:hypothetical protein